MAQSKPQPIIVPAEDDGDLVHTAERPFCGDGSCGCHEDETLIEEVAYLVSAGKLTPDEATDLIAGR